MKKFLTFLITLTVIVFAGINLIIFEIIPIPENLSTSLLGSSTEQTKQNTEKEEKTTKKTKVARKISYEERIKKGDLLLKNNYLSLALNEYTLASNMAPEKMQPYFNIGKIHLQTQNFDKAIKNFEQALLFDQSNLETKINLGKALIKNNNFERAKQAFTSIEENNQSALYYKAILSAFYSDYEESKKLFKKTIEINTTQELSNQSEQFLNIFSVYDQTKDAPESYLKTLFAKQLNQYEHFTLSLKLINDVLTESPDYRDAWILKGYALLKQNYFLQSIEAFDQALLLDPQKAETRYFLGLAYFSINKLPEAITHIEIALQNGFEPKIQAYQKLAEMYVVLENYEAAIKNYKKVLENQSTAIDLYIRPIWIYIEHLSSPQEAIKVAKQALEIYPDQAMSYNLLGWAHLGAKQYQEAKSNLEKAISLDDKLGAAYLNLGKLHEETNNIEEAKKNYKKAYELNKEDSVGNLAAKRYNQLINK